MRWWKEDEQGNSKEWERIGVGNSRQQIGERKTSSGRQQTSGADDDDDTDDDTMTTPMTTDAQTKRFNPLTPCLEASEPHIMVDSMAAAKMNFTFIILFPLELKGKRNNKIVS